MPTRTAKTCGPDASTLASSWRINPHNDGGKKADHRGEHGISRKPLRVECRVIPVTRCEYSCAYLLPIAHTRLRVHRAPGIPHALCFQGGRFHQTSDASRRENAKVCLHSPSLRAKRSNPLFLSCFTMDCFASLAMTVTIICALDV